MRKDSASARSRRCRSTAAADREPSTGPVWPAGIPPRPDAGYFPGETGCAAALRVSLVPHFFEASTSALIFERNEKSSALRDARLVFRAAGNTIWFDRRGSYVGIRTEATRGTRNRISQSTTAQDCNPGLCCFRLAGTGRVVSYGTERDDPARSASRR